jgi:hypothetical protein
LEKHITFQKANERSEENFSHNNWLNQLITRWYNCDPGLMAQEYGIVETGTGAA